MNFDTIYDDPAMKLWESVNLRCVVAAWKLMKADVRAIEGADGKFQNYFKQRYFDWLLSDENRIEKNIAIMMIFEETILDQELTDYFIPEEKAAREKESKRLFEKLFEIISNVEETKQPVAENEQEEQ